MRPFVLRVLLATALLPVPATPVHAQFTDPAGLTQRIVMIANQITQIGHQISTLGEARDQVSNLEDTLTQMRDEALGEVGALADAFDSMSSNPASLLGGGAVTWAQDFGADALPHVQALTSMSDAGNALTNRWRTDLAAADVVGGADIAGLFTDPLVGMEVAEDFAAQRSAAERQRVFDYAAFDAAERLTETLGNAQLSLAGIRAQTNLSPTALQQAQVTTDLTASEVDVAQAQLAAYTGIRDALERQQDEIMRRRDLERWVTAERAAQQRTADAQAANAARTQVYRDAMLLPEAGGNGP